jgi:hypothetical protein
LGWPSIAEELIAAKIDPDLVAGISVGWYFGSLSMVALGLAVLLVAHAVRTDLWAFRAALVVGLAYLAFGVAAILYRSPRPQFGAFLVTGILIAGGSVQARRVA